MARDDPTAQPALSLGHSVDSPASHPAHIQLAGALDTGYLGTELACSWYSKENKQMKKQDSALLQHSKNCNGGEVISATDAFHTS